MTYEHLVVTKKEAYEPHNEYQSKLNYIRFSLWCIRFCGSIKNFLSMKSCEIEFFASDNTRHTEVVFFRRASPFWKTVYLLGNLMNQDTELTEQQYFISINHSKKELYVLGTGVFHCTSAEEFCRCKYCASKHNQFSDEFYNWISQY